MTLKFTPKRKRIEFSDGDYIEVRGLNVPDISKLVETHRESAIMLYNKFTGLDAQPFTEDESSALATILVTTVPAVVAHVIAMACESEDQFELITQLPMDVQVSALEAISNLTFTMQGGVKNFVETVLRISEGVNGLKENLEKPRN